MKARNVLIVMAALVPCAAFAADRYVQSAQAIPNLQKVTARIGQDVSGRVEFPSVLPAASTPLFAYAQSDKQNGNYTLYIDTQRDCKGAHYCSLGALSAAKGQTPAPLSDLNGQDISAQVKLANGERAYFTPGHSMGDFWPAQIQWTRNGVLYTLTWNGSFPDGERDTLLKLANSIQMH
jgi:hypothetical protein